MVKGPFSSTSFDNSANFASSSSGASFESLITSDIGGVSFHLFSSIDGVLNSVVFQTELVSAHVGNPKAFNHLAAKPSKLIIYM